MMALHTLDAVVRAGATGLVDALVVGTAIALLAGMLNLLLRQRSAATRFVFLMTALLATASLPLLRLSAGAATGSKSLVHFADSWAPWILGTWLIIAVLALARVAIGIWRLRRRRSGCSRPAPGDLTASFEEAVAMYCPTRKVELLVSAEATVPAALGFFRPAVMLPAWVVEEMSAEEIRHILIHELSHLRRRDDWTNLLQQVVKSLLFFHPAVWWMEDRLSLEREMACDDAVLVRTPNPRAYAECLARMAERSFLRRGLAMAQAAVSRVRQTSQRVARILKSDNSAPRHGASISAAIAVVVTIVGVGAVVHTPVLLSFDASPAVSLAHASVPAISAPGLKPVMAAWHETQSRKPLPKALVRPAVHRTIVNKHAAPVNRPQVLRTSFSDDGETTITRMVVVVMKDGQGVAVWHITTWQYSPSQQARSAHKTT